MPSFTPRPQRRWISMNKAVPSGLAKKAKEKMTNAYSVPSSLSTKGKKTAGNTSADAMP
ncbi:hypothetical protein D9M73_43770 [compost metagenome]